MSIERSSACHAPNPCANNSAKPQGGANDPSADPGAPSFMAVLSTSMEPGSDGPAQTAAAAPDGALPIPAPVGLLPDPALLLAQSLSPVDGEPDAEALAWAALLEPGAGLFTSTMPGLAAPALASGAGLAGELGLTGTDPKAGAKIAGGKTSGVADLADTSLDTGQPAFGDIPGQRARRIAAGATDANRASQDAAGDQLSAKTYAMRVHESRMAAALDNTGARGTGITQTGFTELAGFSLANTGTLVKEAFNLRGVERSALRPLLAAAGASAAGAWVEQSPAGASASSGAVLASDAGTALPGTSVAEKVHYWISRGVQNAQLQLDAFGGGAVEVSISVLGRDAQVEFRTDQPEARKLLQDAMPQLQDMLKGEGLLLSGGFVGDSAQQNGGAQPRRAYPQGAKVSMVNVDTVLAGASAGLGRTAGRTVDVFV